MGASLHPSNKRKSMVLKEPEEPSVKKFKTVSSANKVICTVFLGCKRVIWQEYLLKGTTINVERYCEMIKNLHKAIKRKRSGLLMKGVILLHDNEHPLSANVTQSFRSNFNGTYSDILLVENSGIFNIGNLLSPIFFIYIFLLATVVRFGVCN